MLQQNKILLWFTEKVHNDKQPIHCYSQNIAVRHQIIFLLPLEANWDFRHNTGYWKKNTQHPHFTKLMVN